MEPQPHKLFAEGLKESDVSLDEGAFTRRHFCGGVMPEEIKFEEWGDPRLWRKAAKKFSLYDRVVVVDEQMTRMAEFVVVDLDKRHGEVRLALWASVKLPPRKRNALSKDLANDYEVVIGVHGYRGRRKTDGTWCGPWQKDESNAYRDLLENARKPRERAAA